MAVAQPCDKDYDLLMAEYGLVDVTKLCDNLFVELRYSTEDNFVGRDMYGSLERAYFEPSFAQRIVAAAEELRRRNPELRLLIYDAARPLSVQRTMRRMVEGTPLERFVADGTRGGRHNYGVAVDVTLARLDGTPLDMGRRSTTLRRRRPSRARPIQQRRHHAAPRSIVAICKRFLTRVL